jgi:hypothetical protein
VDALADLNQAFFAHEVASWTKGRRSVNEVGIELLHYWFLPQGPLPLAITGSECSAWSRWRSPTPCWRCSDAWATSRTNCFGPACSHIIV